MSNIPQLPEPTPVREIQYKVIPNPYDVYTAKLAFPTHTAPPPPVEIDSIPNPFATMRQNLTVETGAASDDADGGFKYTQFYITQVTIYPCIFFMIFFSLVIIFIIMKQLKPVMKLYMSVIYYAFSMLFYASQILSVLVFDSVSFGNYKILMA